LKKDLKYLTIAVAALLLVCLTSSGVLRPQLSIYGNSVKIINGFLDNSGELKAPQVGTFSAIIPDNIIGNENPTSSGTSIGFGAKLTKGFNSNLRLRERYLNNNFLAAPFKNGKSIVLSYTYTKRFYIYALREIII